MSQSASYQGFLCWHEIPSSEMTDTRWMYETEAWNRMSYAVMIDIHTTRTAKRGTRVSTTPEQGLGYNHEDWKIAVVGYIVETFYRRKKRKISLELQQEYQVGRKTHSTA